MAGYARVKITELFTDRVSYCADIYTEGDKPLHAVGRYPTFSKAESSAKEWCKLQGLTIIKEY